MIQLADPPKLLIARVMLVFAREMRDLMRDRRTLVAGLALPLLIYPMLGMLLLQLAQVSTQNTTLVAMVGADHLPGEPKLIDGGRFDADLCVQSSIGDIEIVSHPWSTTMDRRSVLQQAAQWVRSGRYEVVVIIPPLTTQDGHPAADPLAMQQPKPTDGGTESAAIEIIFNQADDASAMARERVGHALDLWRDAWVKQRVADAGLPRRVTEPFHAQGVDVAPKGRQAAALWSKLLPFVMLIWALTGAFYPAIDLVAGEKERGTLETLLCSPALREEIVWGKLLAVMCFSILTSLLNVLSMQVTAQLAVGMTESLPIAIEPPPMAATGWLLLALIPLSALFSALALALAAMARSTKEGQYYLMPLMMAILPLVVLPLLPGMVLSVGTSLVPVTGMFLLVRALVDEQYAVATAHLPIVMIVTLGCLMLAVRWARRQFENEQVLFRESERWDLFVWLRHVMRHHQPRPTVMQASLCGVLVLVLLFLGRMALTAPSTDWMSLAKSIVLPQLICVLLPALALAAVFNRNVRSSFQLLRPCWSTVPAAILLAMTIHPTYSALGQMISKQMPISPAVQEALRPFIEAVQAAPLWQVLLLLAVLPAICEELVFRGYILNGLSRDGGHLRGLVLSSIFFGLSHAVLQQSMTACILGLLLGWVCLRTGSVVPTIMMHLTCNGLTVIMSRLGPMFADGWVLQSDGTSITYHPAWSLLCGSMAIVVMLYFSVRQPPRELSTSHAFA
jgi:sodium transport system permease protein